MKIVHISRSDSGGAGLCAYRICKSQRELGLDANLFVLFKTKPDAFVHRVSPVYYYFYKIFYKLLEIANIPCRHTEVIKLKKKYNAVFSLPFAPFRLNNYSLIKDADIIHLHWVDGLLDYPSFFEKYKGKKIVWTLHDDGFFYGIAHYSYDVLKENSLEKECLDIKYHSIEKIQSFGVVFLSNFKYNKFINSRLISNAKKTIINNSVDSKLFHPYQKLESRRRLKLNETYKIFGFCANNIYDKWKGLEVLSKALTSIDPSYVILAIGDANNSNGAYYNNVVPLGRLSSANDISYALSACDYFCMPSYEEAFAQSPLEAMSCGLPLIVFPCSGTEELINPQVGIRCKDFTLEALVDGIKLALSSNFSSEVIRQDVINRFSPSKIAEQYLRFYKEL